MLFAGNVRSSLQVEIIKVSNISILPLYSYSVLLSRQIYFLEGILEAVCKLRSQNCLMSPAVIVVKSKTLGCFKTCLETTDQPFSSSNRFRSKGLKSAAGQISQIKGFKILFSQFS